MNTKKSYRYFIGIDVSRNKLNYAVFEGSTQILHKEGLNEGNDIIGFVRELNNLPKFKLTKALFVMEYTGIYCNPLLATLKKLNATLTQVTPLQIRNSLGVIRGKYDKIDAIRIARFASKNYSEVNLWVAKRSVLEHLSNLFSLKNRLQITQNSLKGPINEQQKFVKEKIYKQSVSSCKKTLTAINKDIISLEKQIKQLINSDERLKRLNEIITSVPFVGPVTSIRIILATNEFTRITEPKKFACYAGVAPFVKNSGMFVGKAKVSHIADKKLKTLLHMCAIASVSKKGELKDYFIRKTQGEGKHKMSVLNAIRFKLILRIFSCLKNDRLFEKHYQAPASSIVMNN